MEIDNTYVHVRIVDPKYINWPYRYIETLDNVSKVELVNSCNEFRKELER